MHAAVARGADAVGWVSAMPSGPGVIDDATVAAVAARVPPPVAAFLLTARTGADGLVAQARAAGATTLQLVDAVPVGAVRAVRAALPHADALLPDSGNPRLAVKELGGTGRVHDWAPSRRVRDLAHAAGGPVFLAGGLRAGNVGEAVRRVRPFGVDVCSGVRTDGRLDAAKLAAA